MGKGGQTIGYWYLMGLHMGAGRGPVDELVEIRVGGLTAWEGSESSFGNESSTSTIQIEAENLFGGEKKEGGVKGPLVILWGGPEQLAPAGMTADLGGAVPGFRGVTTFYFDGKICALNPYPKEWEFRVRRARQGWYNDICWYPAKSRIGIVVDGKQIVAMNGAHILYEVATNPDWGRGLPTSFLDANSYIHAANQLCAEGLGLCIPWFRQEDLSTFTQVVIDHIGGVQYVSRETGKLTLRLIRNDYDIDDLPLFTPSTGLIDIQDDDQSASDTGYNEIIIMAHDPITNTDFGVRAHNLAAIQSVGSIISNTIEYKGLPTRDLAMRKAISELNIQTGIRAPTVVLDRRGWKIAPGMPFRVSWPDRGIVNLVLRAGQVEDGTHENGQIVIKAVEDVFSLPANTYGATEPPAWTPPTYDPEPASATKLIEVPYRSLYRLLPSAELSALTEDSTAIGELASAPVGTPLTEYDLLTKTSVEADYESYPGGHFTGRVVLPAALDPMETTIVFTSVSGLPIDDADFVGDAAMIGEEIVQVVAFDRPTKTMTIARGVMDTVPARHLTGTQVWLLDDDLISDGREYVAGEIISAKVLTRTSTALLNPADADTDTLTLEGRQGRPYPPADVQVNGESIYDLTQFDGLDREITWVERNRLTQADTLLDHLDAGTAAEAGTTYTIRIISEADGATVLATHAGIASTSHTLDATEIASYVGEIGLIVELEAERDGLTSYQQYRFTIYTAPGYGIGYGLSYGGS